MESELLYLFSILMFIGISMVIWSSSCHFSTILYSDNPVTVSLLSLNFITTESAHPGILILRGNFTGLSVFMVSFTEFLKGYSVSSVIVTSCPLATLALTTDGPQATIARPLSLVAIHML